MASLDQYIEYQIYLHIFRILLPILLAFGTAGNVTSIIVLMEPKNRSSSTARILVALAVSDLLTLCVLSPSVWLRIAYDVELRDSSEIVCKCHFFLTLLSGQLSALYCVALSVQRFVCVMLPLKAKFICSLRNTNIAIISITAGLTLVNLHLLFGIGFNEKAKCTRKEEMYSHLAMKIWMIIQAAAVSFVPAIIILVANICIVVKLVKRNRFLATKNVKSSSNAKNSSVNKKTSRMTIILMLVHVSFLVRITPMAIFYLLYGGKQHYYGDSHQDAVILLFWSVAIFVYLANTAVNFVLYFLSGSKFRKDVKDLYCSKWKC